MIGGVLVALLTAALAQSPEPVPSEVRLGPPPAGWLVTDLRDDPGLTLDEVLSAADRHAPKIVAARAKADGALGARLAAAGGWDPVIRSRGWWKQGPYDQTYVEAEVRQDTPLWGLEAAAGWRRGGGSFATYDGWYDTLDRGELFAELALPLLKGGFTDDQRTDVAVAEAERVAAEAAREATRILIAQAAREAWFKWLATGEKLAIAEAFADNAEETLDAVERRIERGDLAPVEALDARRVLFERRQSLLDARKDLAAAAWKLGLYLRGADGSPQPPLQVRPPTLPTPETIPLPHRDHAIVEAWDTRPDITALEAARRARELERRLAQVELLPKLDVKVELRQDLAAEAEDAEPFDAKVGGVLEMPLLLRPGRGKLQKARAELDVATAELQLARDRIAAEIGAAAATLEAELEAAHLADERADLSQQLEDAARRRQDLGELDLFDVYLREQSTLKALKERIDAWLQVHVSHAALDAALGRR